MKSQLGGEKNGSLTVTVAVASGEKETTCSPVGNTMGGRVQVAAPRTSPQTHTWAQALSHDLEYRFSCG